MPLNEQQLEQEICSLQESISGHEAEALDPLYFQQRTMAILRHLLELIRRNDNYWHDADGEVGYA